MWKRNTLIILAGIAAITITILVTYNTKYVVKVRIPIKETTTETTTYYQETTTEIETTTKPTITETTTEKVPETTTVVNQETTTENKKDTYETLYAIGPVLVRNKPELTGKIVTYLKGGEKVKKIGQKGCFAIIDYDYQTLYVPSIRLGKVGLGLGSVLDFFR